MKKEDVRISAFERIQITVDENTFIEFNSNTTFINPLHFDGYREKFKESKTKTGLNEAVVTGYCEIESNPCVMIVMDSHFMMGSMGSVVGEKICMAFEKAVSKRLPIVSFSASGGARMQEGIFSLVQMAKTSAIVYKHSQKGLLYISVITDPTTGGVSASFSSLADIIIAEPGALYGFTGKRIIQETINKILPDDFQTAEAALRNGAVDMVVERHKIKSTLSLLLKLHKG